MKQKTVYEFDITVKGETDISYRIGVLKPTRTQQEEAELIYSTKYQNLVARGIMPQAVLQKKIVDAGVVTDPEHVAKHDAILSELSKKTVELQNLMVDAEYQEKNKDEMARLIKEIAILENKSNDYEECKVDTFENTAEYFATNEVIRWYALNLGVFKLASDEKAEFAPIFPGSNDEQRLAALDKKEEDEDPVYLNSLGLIYRVCQLIKFGVVNPDKIKSFIDKK